MDFESIKTAVVDNWPVWFVTVTLIVAAIIDGKQLKVPNWITFPMIVSGWIFNVYMLGWEGLGFTLLGTVVGLALLLPLYAIGGMGAGDVKLLAGVGAWVGSSVTFYAFCLSAVIGGVIAIGMVLFQRSWLKHKHQFFAILGEISTIGSPTELATIAAERKSRMLLLPYGIPIAIGTIAYFCWAGMLI
ncbi:MAG: A24 family peptidase [Planctomycetota bacterium]|nr:A24 family peptidase [Planctomycetota bacterium]